jgi:predicted DNA-binding transcriptional regulator AlpA
VSAHEPAEMISFGEAQKRLGISRITLWRRVKDLGLTVYVDPFNRRQRLLSWAEIQAARQQPKKSAA